MAIQLAEGLRWNGAVVEGESHGTVYNPVEKNTITWVEVDIKNEVTAEGLN